LVVEEVVKRSFTLTLNKGAGREGNNLKRNKMKFKKTSRMYNRKVTKNTIRGLEWYLRRGAKEFHKHITRR
jgi:transcription antitermination factor NusA-like protein